MISTFHRELKISHGIVSAALIPPLCTTYVNPLFICEAILKLTCFDTVTSKEAISRNADLHSAFFVLIAIHGTSFCAPIL